MFSASAPEYSTVTLTQDEYGGLVGVGRKSSE